MGAVSWSNLLGNNAGGGFGVHLALVGRWSLPAFMGAAKGEGCPCQGGVGVYPWCKGFHPPTMSRLKVWLPSQSFIQNSPTPVQVQNHLTTYNGPFGLLCLESNHVVYSSAQCFSFLQASAMHLMTSDWAKPFQHKRKVFNISGELSMLWPGLSAFHLMT